MARLEWLTEFAVYLDRPSHLSKTSFQLSLPVLAHLQQIVPLAVQVIQLVLDHSSYLAIVGRGNEGTSCLVDRVHAGLVRHDVILQHLSVRKIKINCKKFVSLKAVLNINLKDSALG